MPPLTKLAVVVLGGLVLSLLVVLGGVAYVRSGGSEVKLRAGAEPVANSIPTLDESEEDDADVQALDASTTTTTTTTTTIAAFVAPTSAPPTTRLGPAISSSGAVLAAPSSPTTRTLSGQSCQSLADSDAGEVRCDLIRAKGGDLIWLTSTVRQGVLGATSGRRTYVFRRAGGNSWTVVLERVESGSAGEVSARVADVSGDGAQDVVIGFRSGGSGSPLGFDVVEGPGTVTAHRDVGPASVRVSTGQVDVWTPAGATATHEVIRHVAGSYRVVTTEEVPATQVPPSQL